MNKEILTNQAQQLFVILKNKQNELTLENKQGFDRLYPIVRRAFSRYRRRLRNFR